MNYVETTETEDGIPEMMEMQLTVMDEAQLDKQNQSGDVQEEVKKSEINVTNCVVMVKMMAISHETIIISSQEMDETHPDRLKQDGIDQEDRQLLWTLELRFVEMD